MIDGQFLLKVVVAGFAAVGIEEFLKNFIQPKKSRWYALIMIPLAVGSYVSVELLPISVIGSLLTIGTVQICYETLIQGFRAVISHISGKMQGQESESGESKKRRGRE